MNKVVDGVELFRMIRDGEIKDKTKIKEVKHDDRIYEYDAEVESFLVINRIENYFGIDKNENSIMYYYTDKEFASREFEILSEENEEIDIQSIELFGEIRDVSDWSNNTLSHNQRSIISKVNKLIKALKQLDKKIKE